MSALPRLHAVTDDEVLAADGWMEAATSVLDACGARVALHVRGPRTSGATLHRLTAALVPRARRTGALLVVNDRVDVAMTSGADGLQLGRRSLDVREARALFGAAAPIGRSCHGAAEVATALEEGADWAFVGTIHPTPSHPGLAGIGVEGLGEARRVAGTLPVLGIGGIDVAQVRSLLAAGAHGVAVVRGIWARPDPAEAAVEYLDAIEEAIDG